MNQPAYVHSDYPRIPDDDYQTVDPRCTRALLQHFDPQGRIIDICSTHGSGIVDELRREGYDAIYGIDAFSPKIMDARWIVTNPPYSRPLVDQILTHSVQRLLNDDGLAAVAFLMRNNFDFAASRAHLFHPHTPLGGLYLCQIHMTFRPWWSDERKAQPIHNFVWHVWAKTPQCFMSDGLPFLLYSDGTGPTVKELHHEIQGS